MTRLIFLVCCLVSLPVMATEPPPQPKLFGLGQDCPNGLCPTPIFQRQVVRSNTFGLGRAVNRTVQRQAVVQSIRVPKTEWIEKTIEVPVRKVVTVMEQRTVREAVKTYEVVACPQVYVQRFQVQNCPQQTSYSRTVQRSGGLFRNWFSRIRTRRATRHVSYSGYSPRWQINDGKSVSQHLIDGYPGMHAPMDASYVSSLSTAEQYQAHDHAHGG